MFNLFKNKNIKGNLKIDEIKSCLHAIKSPINNKDIISSGLVTSVLFKEGDVKIIIEINPQDGDLFAPMIKEINQKIGAIDGVNKVSAILTAHSDVINKSPINNQANSKKPPIQDTKPKPNMQSIRPENIGKIIAVGSAKGGVGKSTIAFNLALSLARAGKKVGLLDADIYGPSVPVLMGNDAKIADVADNGKMDPIVGHGIMAMSMGFIVGKGQALIWRGPMLLKALTQLFMGTNWGALDYIIVDLPPGTGDIQLSLAQQARLDGVIIVSTPQEMALADVRRGIDMFNKAKIPVLGMIENMSVLVDETTGAEIDLFGKGGAMRAALELNIPFLGALNFYPALQKASDNGIVANTNAQEVFDAIAQKL
jgi:ATP-binding protein involved in chromosome partitioning